MASKEQVKQALELALNLAQSLSKKESDALLVSKIQEALKVIDTGKAIQKPESQKPHPVDALLKKGKVKLSEGRYKQLIQIYNALQLMGGVTFLSAKQNQHCTWFPIDWNGNKSSALYLVTEWEIASLVSQCSELKGEWEDFDLNQFMEDFDFDQDEY